MPTNKTLRVGVVGCGVVAQGRHLPALSKIGGVKVAAVCDRDQELAKKVAGKFKVGKVYGDFSEMVRKEGLDIVDICASAGVHAPMSIEAMNAGCHVLCEKPMAPSVKDADEMLSVAKKNNVKLSVVHSMLFVPLLLKTRAIFNQGLLGTVTGVDIKLTWAKNVPDIPNKDHWYHKMPDGFFGEIMPHAIYIIGAFLGQLEVVAAHAKKLTSYEWIIADELRVLLEGKTGLGTIGISCNWPQTKGFLDIYGTERNTRIDLFNWTMTQYGVRELTNVTRVAETAKQITQQVSSTTEAVFNVVSGRFTSGHDTLIRHYIKSIQDDTEPPVTPEEGREVVRLEEEIIKKWKK